MRRFLYSRVAVFSLCLALVSCASDPQPARLGTVVRGLSNKEIADALCISMHTVVSHRKHITRKLNIHSTAGLTIYAIVNRLIDIENLE